MTKISDLSALTGASVDAANDLITVVDASETGAARNKKMTFAQLLVGVAAVPLTYLDTDGALAANSDTKIATQKATKTYVDAKVAGLSWKQAVRAATTANGTLATAFENGDTIDGVVLATGDRILIKNQSSGAENGIYVVAASGAPSRATDADSGAELVNATVYVSEGTTNADTQWTCTTNATITPGSTSLAFAQLATGGGNLDGLSDVTITSGAQGDILYRNSSGDYVNLAPGTSGHFLKTQGAGANPVWAAASGGSGLYRKVFGPVGSNLSFPASNYATLDTRNTRPCLDFDGVTSETIYFSDSLPAGFGTGGIDVVLQIAATSATSGDCKFEVAFERLTGLDLDTDSFATAKSVTMTVNGTSGVLTTGTISFSNSEIDSLVGDDGYRMKVTRLPADAADTVTTDIELYLVAVEEQ